MAIDVEVSRRLFTVDEYHRMAEAGIFHPDERVELIEGEIVEMSPIGPRHAGCVINANRLFMTRLGDRIVLSPQNPVVIRPRSEPQPDLLLLRPRTISYSREHPTPEDVALAVEVADTAPMRRYRRSRSPTSASPSRTSSPDHRSSQRRQGSA
jgi:Uma2 family endonuclease